MVAVETGIRAIPVAGTILTGIAGVNKEDYNKLSVLEKTTELVSIE